MMWVRWGLLALLIAVAFPVLTHAQDDASESTQVGTLVYFEGAVEVKSPEEVWAAATIDQPLHREQQIRTGPTARAEIKWQNGTKSTIGPQSTQTVGALYEHVDAHPGQRREGIVDKFVDLFQGQASSSDDVGGIRRAEAEVEPQSEPGGLYWKTFEEVSFDDAQQHVQQKDYAAAARAFHLFLQQNPDHPKAPNAKLGMGLSYLKLNNPVQARSALQSLVSDYPDDPLTDRARTILDRM